MHYMYKIYRGFVYIVFLLDFLFFEPKFNFCDAQVLILLAHLFAHNDHLFPH